MSAATAFQWWMAESTTAALHALHCRHSTRASLLHARQSMASAAVVPPGAAQNVAFTRSNPQYAGGLQHPDCTKKKNWKKVIYHHDAISSGPTVGCACHGRWNETNGSAGACVAYLNERQVLVVELAGVDPALDAAEPAAAGAHARVGEAALDPAPRLVVPDPVPQPVGVVPDPVVPVPGRGHGGGRAPVGDGEGERGGHEHAGEDQEHAGHVDPEERRGAAARAGERHEREQEERRAQRHGGHPHQALALGGRLRQDVRARADEHHGDDEGDRVQGGQDAIGETHHGAAPTPTRRSNAVLLVYTVHERPLRFY